MAYIENQELRLDPDSDSDKFPFICGMFDENDLGYTRGLSEVFIDRLEEWKEDEPEANVQPEIDYIELHDIDYITVTY